MEQSHHTNTSFQEDEPFSLQNELKKLGNLIVYALKQWRLLAIAAIVGALLGLAYNSWLRPLTYTARTTFVVEESKMGGGSIASALAGQIGIDIGGLTGGGSSGILSGDNVQELVKSHKLMRKTLLTAYDSSSPQISLADVYAESIGWKKKWANSGRVGRQISFPAGSVKLGRTEDSLLQKMIARIIKSDLSIGKTDKKLTFFELSITMRDEKLSLLFSQRLLKAATDFYIDTKTKRLSNNVKRLQNKADSLAISLNRKTYSSADASRKLLDANPIYAEPEVSAEISFRDKLTQATIYAEIVKNLEISKTALIQETPTIQIVDDPETPLQDNKIRWWMAVFIGASLLILLTAIIIIATKRPSPRK